MCRIGTKAIYLINTFTIYGNTMGLTPYKREHVTSIPSMQGDLLDPSLPLSIPHMSHTPKLGQNMRRLL